MNKNDEIERLLSEQQTQEEKMKIVIRELRAMAEGAGRYGAFKGASEWTKNVWYAAAEMIEGHSERILH